MIADSMPPPPRCELTHPMPMITIGFFYFSCLQDAERRNKQFLADRTARCIIGYWRDNVVCLSVCDAVAKRYIPQQKCLNK